MNLKKKVAVIRHGVGRESKKVLRILENNIYKEINNINDYDFNFFYLFREVKTENSIRNKEKNVTSQFVTLPYEKVINVKLPDSKSFFIRFKNYLKYDIHKDEFQSYSNLLKQCYMFKKFSEEVDINQFSSFIVLRDDVIILKLKNLKKYIFSSQFGYVTSMWDWEGGVHERFFMCSKDIFFRLTFKYENLRSVILKKNKVNPVHYTGEFLTLKILKKHNFCIVPVNIKTQRVRQGFRLQRERHRIRMHDPLEVLNLIKSFVFSRLIILTISIKQLFLKIFVF